jgi:hypothetical protein
MEEIVVTGRGVSRTPPYVRFKERIDLLRLNLLTDNLVLEDRWLCLSLSP